MLAIAFSLVPPLGDVGEIRIKPIAPFATKFCFFIGNPSRDPPTNGSFGHAETTRNLFAGEALFAQFEQLLIPIRSLRMVSQVSAARKGIWIRKLAWKG